MSPKTESTSRTPVPAASSRSSSRPGADNQQSAPVAIMTTQALDSDHQRFGHIGLPVSNGEIKPRVGISNSAHPDHAGLADAVDHRTSSPAIDSNSTETSSTHQDLQQAWGNSEDKVILSSETSPSLQKAVLNIEIPFLEQSSSIEQPAASLVSPPASTHEDAEKSPSVSQRSNLTPCTTSSRHSSRHPKQVQRYTPESGPARRASTSSVGEAVASKSDTTGTKLSCVRLEVEAPRAQRGVKNDISPDVVADEESLKLIKELQAQEHGLRRRGRV